MKLKDSRVSMFNEYLGELNKNNWIIYNNLSGAMIEVGSNIYESLMNNRLDNLSNLDVLKSLEYGKFIIENEVNEIQELEKVREQIAKSAKVIGLQILPTSRCNFRCPYCYEQSQESGKIMSEQVMDSIINFVQDKIKTTTNYLNISWYGGEPLLAVERIKYLSEAFNKISKENNIIYNASMVTNGYLLNQKNVEQLIKYNIRAFQITIDGPERIHNERRMLRNGGKTWKTIVNNIKLALSKNLSICVRINVDQTNIESINELFSDFKSLEIFDKVSYSIGVVSNFGNVCRSIEDTLLSVEEVNEKMEQEEILKAINESRSGLIRPMPDFVGCVATAKNSIIIAPDGKLYKCLKTIEDPNEICGSIVKPDKKNKNLKKWENVNNLKAENCRKCSMLPVCPGNGCAFDLLKKKINIFECDANRIHKKYIERLKVIYHRRKETQKINKEVRHGLN